MRDQLDRQLELGLGAEGVGHRVEQLAVTVDSRPGRTAFTVRIPLRAARSTSAHTAG